MQAQWAVAAIVVALIWAAMILLTSSALAGLPQADSVMRTLAGGATACIIVLGGMAARAGKVR